MRGHIRIRTPDDPGRWTAQGDLVPGHPYSYVSGDVAVLVDWEMSGPEEPPIYIEPYAPDPIEHWDWVLLAVVLGALAIFALRWGLVR